MKNSETFFDRPCIVVDPHLKNFGIEGHITADNRSRDNTVTIQLVSSDPKVDDMKMNLDVGTNLRPPQVIVMSYQMLSLGLYKENVSKNWVALSALKNHYNALSSSDKVHLAQLVYRFRALIEQTLADTDVDVLTTPDPSTVFKLLQLRNVIRGVCHLRNITDFPSSVLPPWERKQTTAKA
jgi:hypothetical protein